MPDLKGYSPGGRRRRAPFAAERTGVEEEEPSMSSTDPTDLPNVAQILSTVLQRVTREQQPLLIAHAERLAAERYRDWASHPTQATRKAQLLACADREEEIARRVEALYPAAASIQRVIVDENPALGEINRMLFAGRPLTQQFAIQAQGERLGAATWRAFAAHADDGPRRSVFLGCAELEEQSAVVLENVLTREP
jgi:hypothetical protein